MLRRQGKQCCHSIRRMCLLIWQCAHVGYVTSSISDLAFDQFTIAWRSLVVLILHSADSRYQFRVTELACCVNRYVKTWLLALFFLVSKRYFEF